jgi:ketosteroid isomerase-like protein
MSRDNVEIVRRAFEAFNDGDWDRSLTDAHDDVEWVNLIGRNLDQPARLRGRDEIQRFWGDFFGVWDSSVMKLVEVESHGDHVLVRAHFESRGGASGVPIKLDYFGVYEFRDGLIARIENYETREEAVQRAELDQPWPSSHE